MGISITFYLGKGVAGLYSQRRLLIEDMGTVPPTSLYDTNHGTTDETVTVELPEAKVCRAQLIDRIAGVDGRPSLIGFTTNPSVITFPIGHPEFGQLSIIGVEETSSSSSSSSRSSSSTSSLSSSSLSTSSHSSSSSSTSSLSSSSTSSISSSSTSSASSLSSSSTSSLSSSSSSTSSASSSSSTSS